MGTYTAAVTDEAGQTMATFQGLAYYKSPVPKAEGQK